MNRDRSTDRPNIILILTDHFRRDALTPRTTPKLWALAGAGTRFENAYSAAPLCQPARNCIITGNYPSQHGVCGNQSPPIRRELRDDVFMRHLQLAGYATAMIGKHHYIDRYGIGMDVTEDDEAVRAYGFEHVCQVVDDGENLHNDDEFTHYLQQTGRLLQYREIQRTNAWACKAFPFEGDDDTVDGFIVRQGIRHLQSWDRQRPHYLNLSFVGPHPPFWHPGDLQHDPASVPAPIGCEPRPADCLRKAHYLDRCSLIDRCVGRLLTALKEAGQAENTVILFTSDHGENAGDYGIWDKRFFFEQSCGVPLIVSGAGMPAEQRQCGSRVSKALVTHLDLYPTILSLAGREQVRGREREGVDLCDVLADTPGSGHQEIHAELGTAVMIRTGNWKLVFDPEAGGVQHLYNLVRDPLELDNLAGAAGYERVTAGLIERILEHRIRITQFTHAKEEQRVQRVRIP